MALNSAKDLQLIQSLATHRHFGRAAAALGLSQPAVSRALAQLEAELGEPLFERATMLPTPFGKIVLRVGAGLLAGFAEMKHEIALLKGAEAGELTVAMGPYPAAISGQAAAARLSQLHPRLTIDLRTMNWWDAVEAAALGKVDLALADVTEASDNGELEVRPIRNQPFNFICRGGHPLTRKEKPSFEDTLEYPWVAPIIPRAFSQLPTTEKPFGTYDPVRQRLVPRIVVETFQAIKEIVAASDAISAALPFQIAPEVGAGRLATLFEVPFVSLNYGFILKKARTLSPAARAYMKLVLEIESRHR